MSNIAVLAGLIIKILFIGLPCCILYFFAKYRKSLKVAIPLGILFIITLLASLYFFKTGYDANKEASKKFLGYYRLEKLDGKDCEDCKVNLNSNNHYDIIVNDKTIGEGKWEVTLDGEGGGYYLILENGPKYMLFETDRNIAYIDRKSD